ncbi:MAG: hypothetical protein NWF01_09630 [Candidatus Bathyarchaeota archaeon]|nr:hypothetical protein [Candidatus Bathyarchaeota archaeon]
MKKQSVVVVFVFFLFLLPFSLGNAEADSANPTWTIQTVQQGQTAWLSLALDANDFPCIGNGDIYATWNGSNWTTQFIDSSRSFYGDSFLVLDVQGIPHVCCSSSSGLKYAILNGSTWVIQTVDLDGIYPSLVLDKAGNPHVSYQDRENLLLKYAVWNGSEWSIEVIDSTDIADSSCIALDSMGYPHICYSGGVNGTLRHAFWNGSAWVVEDVVSERAWSISLKVDAQDNLHLCYTVSGDQRGLKYAILSSSEWVVQMVDPAGWAASLALDKSGVPCIAYEDTSFDVKFTKLGSLGWSTQSIDKYDSTSGMRNGYISIVLDSNGNPHICYGNSNGTCYATTILPKITAIPTEAPNEWLSLDTSGLIAGVSVSAVIVVLAVIALWQKKLKTGS